MANEHSSSKTNASFSEQVNRFSPNFWICNLIEAFERLAFFGVIAIRGLYMKNALHISDAARGNIMGTWALIQCLVPMVSGGYADSYGYRRSMYVAFTINILGYLLMAHSSGVYSMFGAACLVGLGTAIFKPPVQGSVAKSLDEQNSGTGFGVFYWLVNVGGFFAPMAAASLRGTSANPTWSYVFYGAAATTAINFLPATFLFKEPAIAQSSKDKSPVAIFAETITVLVRDGRMLAFLLIISGFWFMFMQLWDLLPIHIDEWVDTRDVGGFIKGFGGFWQSSGLADNRWWVFGGVSGLGAAGFALFKRQRLLVGLTVMVALMFVIVGSQWQGYLDTHGGAKPEILINIDSFAIVLLVIPVSFVFGRYPMIVALLSGMLIGTIGFVGGGLFGSGNLVSLMIFVFAVGEMICSPKFSEYIGMTAPPDKKALYMGYSNIPYAIGWAGGNFVSHRLYGAISKRETLAARYMTEKLHATEAEMAAFELAKKGLRRGQRPDEPMLAAINEKLLAAGDPRAYRGSDPVDARFGAIRVLRQTYHPGRIWWFLGVIGLLSLAGMAIFYVVSRPKKRPASPAAPSE